MRTRVNPASRTCEAFTTLADLRALRRIPDRAIERSDGAAWYLRVMGELFVDLRYRGLPLGNGIRLTQIQARHGYLEISAPMPVGSGIAMHVDGFIIDAHVLAVHEQTTVSERPPGMLVQPLLDSEAAIAWWSRAGGLPVQSLHAERDPSRSAAAERDQAQSPAAAASAPPALDSAASIAPTVSALAETVDAADAANEPGSSLAPEVASTESIAAPGDIDHDIASADSTDSESLSAPATSQVGHEGSDGAEASSDSQPPDVPARASESTTRGRKRRRGNRR